MNGTPTKRAMVVTGVNNIDTGKWMFDEIRVVMPDGDPGHYVATVIENESPFEDMPPITPDEARANAALWAEASTVYAETGLRPRELDAIRGRLAGDLTHLLFAVRRQLEYDENCDTHFSDGLKSVYAMIEGGAQ